MTVLNLIWVQLVAIINRKSLSARELKTCVWDEFKWRLNRSITFGFAFHLDCDSEIIEDKYPLVKIELFQLEDREKFN